MARDFVINGPTMVHVKGGAHGALTEYTELGLSVDQIRVVPNFGHEDVPCTDFGPNAPPDVLTRLASVRVDLTLVHYDADVLHYLLNESLGWGEPNLTDVRMAPNGTPLGAGLPMYASGNHLVTVSLTAAHMGGNVVEGNDLTRPDVVFRSCYLDDVPAVIPLGTNATQAAVRLRAIPYVPLWVTGEQYIQGGYTLATGGSTLPAQPGLTIGGVPHYFRELSCSGNPIWTLE